MRKPYILRASIGGMLTLLLIVVLAAAPVHAIESFGVGAVPANPQANNPRTKSIFVYRLSPGQGTTDGIKLVNNSDTVKTLNVYAVDSQISSDGAFACAQHADIAKQVGTWITLSKNQVTLQPKTNEVVNFSVAVPNGADVGEHDGCIAIQDASAAVSQGQNGIALSFRSALRVAITVPGNLVANLTFLDVKAKPINQNTLQVTPTVQNRGNVSLDTNLNVKLLNIFGKSVVSSGGEFPVLRDAAGRFNLELETPFWGGFYKQSTQAQYAPLAQDGEQPPTSSLTAQAKWLFIMPHPIAALIEVGSMVLIAGITTIIIWRRRYYRLLHMRASRYKVQPEDNLQTIAKAHNLSWRKLAKLNKLKPPYALHSGQIIRIPRISPKPDTAKSSTSPKK